MTGYAQVKSQTSDGSSFVLSLKSVNHRFLDLQLRLPPDMDELEIKIRRMLKERLARGHVDVTLNLERHGGEGFELNHDLVAASEFVTPGEPDLNVILRIPGALITATGVDGNFESAVLASLDKAVARLNIMREEDGRGMEAELRRRLQALEQANREVSRLRSAVSRAYRDKVYARMQELLEQVDEDRILQEAAILAERSDVQEELVRVETHIQHFRSLLDEGGEVGKKLDFLLQELNREANTLLSKTSGIAGEGLGITELGLLMKAEIEKCREQVQNLE
jgi:uncharacterized protein (TIGR00255 family)